MNMEGTSRYWLPVGGGGGGGGGDGGGKKFFFGGEGGGGKKIQQSLRRAGIAVAWDVVAGYLVVFMGKTQPSQCLSPPGIINGYRRNVREVWWNAGGVT